MLQLAMAMLLWLILLALKVTLHDITYMMLKCRDASYVVKNVCRNLND